MAKEQKRKLENEWNSVSDNDNNANDLKIITLPSTNAAFNKKTTTITLLDKFDTLNEGVSALSIKQTFEDLPEWVISSSYLVPVFYTESGFSFEEINLPGFSVPLPDPTQIFIWEVDHMWKKIENNYILQVDIGGILFQGPMAYSLVQIPLFIDLSLVVFNKRILHEIQHNKT